LSAFAADLVRYPVSVIAATGSSASPLAAKAATGTVPIVFTTGGDALKLGFVSSFNRPGHNVTGVSFLAYELAQKRLQLLHELVPAATAIGVLNNPDGPSSQSETGEVQAAARALGAHLGCRFTSRARAANARSMRLSRASSSSVSTRSSSPPKRS
jgi:putative tryptophan/tyrosine transport system substrate-binding protein